MINKNNLFLGSLKTTKEKCRQILKKQLIMEIILLLLIPKAICLWYQDNYWKKEAIRSVL